MEKIDVIQQVNELRNILLYANKIGFLFGAGSSCAFGLPDINSLTEEVKLKLESSQQNLLDKISSLTKKRTLKEIVTIEDILTFLRKIRDITDSREDLSFQDISGKQTHMLDDSICKSIYQIISEKEKSANIKELRRFFAWYDNANSKFVKEIFTTNYDMLLERAMEANYISFYDGFVGSFEPFFNSESIEELANFTEREFTRNWIRLWKLHGSLNWSIKPASGIGAERIIRLGKVDKPEHELMIYPSTEKYNLSRREPFVAYFDRLKKYLLQGENLFVCVGYSFSDQHINEIIYNALRQNNRLFVLVLCYSDDQVDNMASYASAYLNLCVLGPTKLIKAGSIKEWKYCSQDENEMVDLFWDKAKNRFLLGDFKKLIEFLIDNSGKSFDIEDIINGK